MAFHEVQFPVDISYGSNGGPMRRTDVFTTSSGFESRNSLWADSLRMYNAAYGVKTLEQLYNVLEFFEERRGMFHGFRYKDWIDYKSGSPDDPVDDGDQFLGNGDGSTVTFQLRKVYGGVFDPWYRTITKPVTGTVVVAVDGTPVSISSVDTTTGVVTLNSAPANLASVTAGFEFDVPVRFDTDQLDPSIENFNSGNLDIPIKEIRV